MAQLNLGKFLDCLVRYKRDCELTVWTQREISKFYFANLLARRVQINLQPAEMIFEICKRVQEKNFYFHKSETKICGIQFLAKTGNPAFSEELTLQDINLLKFIAKYENLLQYDYDRRSSGFQCLSGWAGTLIPDKFIPVTSGHFRHTIAYLFDIEPSRFGDEEYDFFTHSQKYFKLTKEKLKQFDLNSLYLKQCDEYVRFNYGKAAPKKSYSEYDWNWLTQDFHLYIYREVLCLDTVARISVQQKKPRNVSNVQNYKERKFLNIYVP